VTDLIIETGDLHKRFGTVHALNGLDLRVSRGSICGFLGRNGAGKTTTMKVLLGMVRPDAGMARVFGRDVEEPGAGVAIRMRTGFVSDEKDLFDEMTVSQITRFTAAFFPGWRRDLEDHYTRRFGLQADRRVKTLSCGTRTKVAVMLALARGAELLMLDEPTSGLDPAAAEDVLQAIVSQVAREGTTIFFSSHQIPEVEQISDAIAIIDRGRTVVSGSLDEVRNAFQRVVLVFASEAPDHQFAAPGVTRVSRQGRTLSLVTRGRLDALRAEALALGAVSVDVSPVSLKDLFLESIAWEVL
jgi:ABC-2 type transport system ATP-binding protein